MSQGALTQEEIDQLLGGGEESSGLSAKEEELLATYSNTLGEVIGLVLGQLTGKSPEVTWKGTERIKTEPDYKHTIGELDRQLEQMLQHLHGSIPLSSYRNQSHMYWDCTLPGFAGYFAAMLYNQNNVAAEASPVTTLLEIEVGRDLSRDVIDVHVCVAGREVAC